MGKKSRKKKERRALAAKGIVRTDVLVAAPDAAAPVLKAPAPGNPVPVSDGSFAADVLHSPIPVLVDFWASWCGPCKHIAPILDELAPTWQGRVKIAKYNTERNRRVMEQLGIRSIPTLVLYHQGEVIGTKVGLQPKAALRSWVEGLVPGGA